MRPGTSGNSALRPLSPGSGLEAKYIRKRKSTIIRITGFYKNVQIRHIVTILGFFCWFLFNCLRLTASLTIVAMVNWTAVGLQDRPRLHYINTDNHTLIGSKASSTDVCRPGVVLKRQDGPFVWDTNVQGAIMTAYFLGLAAGQMPGGSWAQAYSPKWVIQIGTLTTALMVILSPPAAYIDHHYLYMVSLIKGFGQGVVVPAFSLLAGRWFPVQERGILMAFCIVGMPFGGFVTLLTSGYMCASEQWGWESVYYLWGVVTLVFCALWHYFIYDSPLKHPHIHHHELFRIMSLRTLEAARLTEKSKLPLGVVFKSLPVWSYFLLGFSSVWTISLYSIVLPTYLGTMLKYPLEENGVYASLSTLCQGVFLLIAAFGCRHLESKQYSPSKLCKVIITVGLLSFVVCMLCLKLVDCGSGYDLVLLIFALGISGLSFSAINTLPVDLAPRFAGSLTALSCIFGSLTGVLIPIVLTLFSGGRKPSLEEWFYLYLLSAVLCLFSIAFFLLLGSTEVQPWNYPEATTPTGTGYDESQRRQLDVPNVILINDG